MHASDSKYIKEVWAENLEEEMGYLRDLVEEYPYLAMVCIYIIIYYFHYTNTVQFNPIALKE